MTEIEYRSVPTVTVYETSGIASGGSVAVPATIGALMPGFDAALAAAGRDPIEPGIFWYEPIEGTEDLRVHISYTADPVPVPGDGYEVTTLPAVDTMAVLVHRGDLSGIAEAWGTLMQQVVADGYRMSAVCHEVYVHAPGHEPGPDWVTELQVPVEKV